VQGDYQKAQIYISDSQFELNAAFQGGVFSVKDSSFLEC